MNWLDILLIIVVVGSIVGGLISGLIKILLTVVGLIVGVILAGNYAGALADKLTFISDARTANIVAFVLIMVVVMIIAAIIAFLLKKLASAVLLGWINRLGGAILGLLLGLIFTGAILTMYVKYMGITDTLMDSWMATFLVDKFPIVLGFLPEKFDSVRDFFR